MTIKYFVEYYNETAGGGGYSKTFNEIDLAKQYFNVLVKTEEGNKDGRLVKQKMSIEILEVHKGNKGARKWKN